MSIVLTREKCSILFISWYISSLRSRGERRMSALQCVRHVYQTDGLRGFYRGMSASYAGISETVIHFVIYESIKRRILETRAATRMDQENETTREASDFMYMMMAAATSKTCATCLAYPHGEQRCLALYFSTHPYTHNCESVRS